MEMAMYLAMRVKRKYDLEGEESARNYYSLFFSKVYLQEFQEDTDMILIADGYENCIVTAE